LKDAAHNNEIKIKWIDTKNQIADILTKLMGAKPYCELRDKMQTQY
jgi:kynureninase